MQEILNTAYGDSGFKGLLLTQLVILISLIFSGMMGTTVVRRAPSKNIAMKTINTEVNGDLRNRSRLKSLAHSSAGDSPQKRDHK